MTPLESFAPAGMLLLMLGLALLPFVAMVVTSYTKLVVVLGLLRNALGVQQVPPNMVLNGIALIVTCYVMAPLFMEASQSFGGAPAAAQNAPGIGSMRSTEQVLKSFDAAREPFKRFLLKHSAEKERQFFLRSASAIWPAEQARSLHADDLIVLAPAFLLTELAAAFRIGFLLYLGFVVVDIVIANVLLAMGLQQVMPTNVAIPFKLLLFVVLDGWSRLIHGLVLTYR